ncbi:arylformamidase [Stappia indica]|uniref:Arylformamidase n=2 Tax=Stappia indica TaxID=538381 RepID=A0A285T7B0_9HYPH|nr:arylformamidase [Stappia indica]
MSAVYLNYSQAELDRAYDQSCWAPGMADTLAAYTALSLAQRQETPAETVRYADDDMGGIDVFNGSADGPLIYFLHGGAWRSGDRSMYSFLARNLERTGCPLAVPDYPKIQSVGLPAMVDRVAAALRALLAQRPDYARRGLVLAGHSSGAHLAACLATGAGGADIAQRVSACLLVSGIYDMEPVLLSSRRNYVDLTGAEALRLSPLEHIEVLEPGRIVLAYGSRESPEFVRQAEAFGRALVSMRHDVRMLRIEDRDHFSILLECNDPASALWQALTSLTASTPRCEAPRTKEMQGPD